ncbi:hypothetical protein [Enterococcus sp. HY326]|uniref:hypothetical protein n=1 Tax=Enterococcus sp. HY326 TaxID=2971265 RepID=UPI00223F1CA9|nr:hypothetical protein [Enterococcus sp. HY326]
MGDVKSYLRFKRQLNKHDLPAKLLLLLPFLLISGLFFTNQLLNNREQSEIQRSYQEQEAYQQFTIDADYLYDDPSFPKTMQVIREGTEALVAKFALYHQGTTSEKLTLEITELEKYYQLAPRVWWRYPDMEQEVYGFYPTFFVDGKLLTDRYLLKNDMKPDSMRYGTGTATFLVSLSGYLTGILGLVYFILCFAFSNLRRNEAGKYRYFAVQPLGRSRIFLADFFEFILKSFVYLLGIFAFAYLLAKVLGPSQGWDYPVLIATGNQIGQLSILPIWQYLFITSGLFLLNLCFFYFCVQLLFCLLRKSFVVVGLTLAIFAYFFVLSQLILPENIQLIAAYSPTTYVNPSQIMIGQSHEPQQLVMETYEQSNWETDFFLFENYAFTTENAGYYMGHNLIVRTGNSQISWSKGVLSLVVINGLLFLLSIGLFNKRMCD